MYRYFIVIFLLIASYGVYAQKYVMVWNDEFNTPGLPDTTKWNYEIGKIRNNELQYYTKGRLENTRIEDSVLIIEARKENYEGADYTSGSIISKGIGDWKYGKVEISAKVSAGKGTWPALWMMPTYSEYGGWPKSGEIDIMEYIGVEPQNLYYTAHFQGTGTTGHSSSGSGPKSYFTNPWERFIKFTLIWTPEKLEWYADDIKFHTYLKSGDDYRTWPFDKEFYLILNLAYGGSWGGYNGVDDSKLPHKFLVDYVRVYQLQDSEGPFSLHIQQAKGGTVEVFPQLDSYPEGTEVTLTANPDSSYVFKSWKHMSRGNPYTFTVNKNMTVSPLFYNENELLSNNSFDTNWLPWTFYVYNSATTTYSSSIVNGKFGINITKSPGTDWHFGFQEQGIAMPKGKYLLRFDAVAEQSKSLLITVSKNYTDWGAIVTKRVTITTSEKSYEIPIEMAVTDNNTRLYFGVGNFSGQFAIDNISLTRINETFTGLTKNDKINAETLIYPNPANKSFTIEFSANDNYQEHSISLLTLDGKLAYQTKTFQNISVIHPEEITPGIYIVRISSNQFSSSKKLIVY